MSEDVKKGIEETFDSAAKLYDANVQFELSAKQMERLVTQSGVCPNTILDLSTGTGHIALSLANAYPNDKVVGVDLSSNMLEVAKEKAVGVDNVTFIQADVEVYSPSEMVDVITCGYGLFFYPNMKQTVKRILSWLNDDGLFAFSSFTTQAFEPYSKLFLDALKSKHDIAFPEGLDDVLLNTTEQIDELLLGLDVSYEVKHFPIRYSLSPNEWFDLLNSTGYKGLLSRLNQEELEAFKAHYLELLKPYECDGLLEVNADSYFTLVKKGL